MARSITRRPNLILDVDLVILNLEVVVLFTQQVEVATRRLFGLLGASGEKILRDFALNTGGRRDQSLGMLLEQFKVDTRTIEETLRCRRR